MSSNSSTAETNSETRAETATEPLFTGLPSGIVPYVAILAALLSAGIHLSMAPTIMEFDTTMGILFVLAGLGFVGGIGVYLTRYWRRELYLVAILFALAQIAAFFVMGGRVSEMAIASKAAEAVFSIAAAFLYVTDRPE